MLNYIDIIGACGVGKSTLRRELFRNASRLRARTGMRPLQLNTALRRCVYKKSRGTVQQAMYRLALCIPSIRRFRMRAYPNPRDYGALKDFAANYSDLMAVARGALSGGGGMVAEPEAAAGYVRFLQQVIAFAILSKYTRQTECVMGDDFIHHSVLRLLPQSGLDPTVVNRYFRVTPRPQAIILLLDDPAHILERVKGREKVAIQHMGKTEDEIVEWSAMAQSVLQRGVAVSRARGIQVIELEAGGRTPSTLAGDVLSSLALGDAKGS